MDSEKNSPPTQSSSDDDSGVTRPMPPYSSTPLPSTGGGEGETVQVSGNGEEATLARPEEDRTLASTGGSVPGSKSKITRPSPEPDQTLTEQEIRATQVDVAAGKLLLNRYRLDKVLGKGGFGAAYLAEDIKLKRRCVVKQMLSPQGISVKELELYRANFERETKLLAELNDPGHPNIPEIFDSFFDPSGYYLVMKYIEGQSLKQALDQTAQGLPWREAIRYVIDVASALQYMHTHGREPVMHRDIKPANILLGSDGRVWLVDFGLAKATPVESTGDLMVTQAAGSLGYTPLEQWLGEAVPASDIYALGATLHHLVTGLNPAQAFAAGVTIEKLKDLHGQFPPLNKINKVLPEVLGDVVSRATHPDPTQRLTALQLKQQLEPLIAGGQAAALYTFKNGKSAKTVPELVELCEAHRQEAEEYLYQGDFQRWFRMINRNDLVEAAEQAVKQGKSHKDGLERFLKLIMPNLATLRARRAAGHTIKWVVQFGLLLLIVLVLVAIAGAYGARWFIQQSIGSYAWSFNNLSLQEPNHFSADRLNADARSIAGAYLDEVRVELASPNGVNFSGKWGSLPLDVPTTVELHEGKPQFHFTHVNGLPLFLIADNINQGVNEGINAAFQNSPVDFSSLTITPEEAVVEVVESQQQGRPALPTATPTSTATPTPPPTSTPTATPEGLALVTIFNESGEDIILEIEGESLEIAANDSKAIEKQPGTYAFRVIFKATGEVGAEGEKSWGVQTYKWRIGSSGD